MWRASRSVYRVPEAAVVSSPTSTEFVDLAKVDIVGLYASYAEAVKAWRGKAQATIDNAHVRYFVVHLHRLLEPDHPETTA